MNKFKLGLDIHGCVDVVPEVFSKLSKIIIDSGNEVIIITGKHIKDGVIEELEECGICYTNIFSIADFHKERGTEIKYDAKGTPWIGEDLWNKTKAEYCKENGIDLHIDDSDVYHNFFTTPYARIIINK